MFNSIDRVLEKLRKEQEELAKPKEKKKRRKTDIRTLRRKHRESVARYRKANPEKEKIYNRKLKWQFYMLRREMKRRQKRGMNGCWEWSLSLNDWLNIWASCPAIEVGLNTFKPAYTLRGRGKGCVQLRRLDPAKPWAKENLSVVLGSRVLYSPTMNES